MKFSELTTEMNRRLKIVAIISTGVVTILFTLNWPIRKFPFTRRLGSKIEAMIGRFWGIAIAYGAGMKISVVGNVLKSDGPFVIVANHIEMWDILILLVALRGVNFRFLAAEELFSIKYVGRAMKLGNQIPFNRQNRPSMVETYKSLNERCFKHGQSVLGFPEGTRSRSQSVAEFGDSLFAYGILDGITFLPIRIWLSDDFRDADVLIGEPFSTEGLKRSDARRVADELHDWMVDTPRPIVDASA